MSLSKSYNFEHAQVVILCDLCNDEVPKPGHYYCRECKQTLCRECEKNHGIFLKSHNVILRTQVANKFTPSCKLNCFDHGDKALFHCEQCKIPVCAECITGKHQGHGLSDLQKSLLKKKEILQKDVNRMQENDLTVLRKWKEDVKIEQDSNEAKFQQIFESVVAEHQDIHKEVDRLHDERLQNIISIQDSQRAIFERNLSEIQRKIDLYGERISHFNHALRENNLTVIYNITKGQGSLIEIGSKPEFPNPPSFEPGNFRSIVESLGRISVSESPSLEKFSHLGAPTILSTFKSPLKEYPSICITNSGSVWLGGDESRKLVMVDIVGYVQQTRKIRSRTNALAAMDNDDIILSPRHEDSRSVSRLKLNEEKYIFDSLSCSYGVSVTPDQMILICTGDGIVLRTKDNGSNVKQIYKGSDESSAIHAIQNTDGYIYISSPTIPAVLMVSEDGILVSTIKYTISGKMLGRPFGLVSDKMGNILCGDCGSQCIFIIDKNQQMEELIDIQDPRWLAIDNYNNLWITQGDGSVVVVKYA